MNIDIGTWINKCGMPLVITDTGNLSFLIDTGASFNVLMRNAYDDHQDLFTPVGKDDYLIGMNGEPQRVFIAEGSIILGGETFHGNFCVLDNTEALNSVQVLTGHKIDGALGIDFLRRFGFTIDFRNNILSNTPH